MTVQWISSAVPEGMVVVVVLDEAVVVVVVGGRVVVGVVVVGGRVIVVDVLVDVAGGPAVVLISSRAAEDYGKRIEACGARGFILKSRLSAAAFAALVQ